MWTVYCARILRELTQKLVLSIGVTFKYAQLHFETTELKKFGSWNSDCYWVIEFSLKFF